MIPISPTIPGEPLNEIVFAKDQPEYIPLPAVVTGDGIVITRWRCSLRERLRILFKGDVYHQQLTFNKPLQPILMETTPPEIVYLGSPRQE